MPPPASSAASSSRRCRTCGGWPSSSARRRSTTSGSSRRCAASARRCARAARSTSRSRRGSVPQRLPADVETALYRIVQEALTNVVKHAGAEPRQHRRHPQERRACMVMIEDDGRGFDPGVASGDGLGLLGMRERVELLDGTLRDRRRAGRRDDADRRAAARLRPLGSGGGVARERGERAPEGGGELEPVPRAGGCDDDPPVPLEDERLVGRVRVEAGLGGERLRDRARDSAAPPRSRPSARRPDRRPPCSSGSAGGPAWCSPALSPTPGAASA